MRYPFKYPVLYGELAMQGKTKKGLADCLHITLAGLRYKQSMETDGDFRGEEMRAAAAYLEQPIDYLFSVDNVACNQTNKAACLNIHEKR